MTAWLWARWAAMTALALGVAVCDLRRRIIPNAVVAGGLGAALGLAVATRSLLPALLGAAAFGGPMLLLWWTGVATGGQGLVGAGDAKAALAFGAMLGMPDAVSGLWWGAAAGGLLAMGAVGRALWTGRRSLWARLRREGATGCLAAIAADPVWGRGIPYGAALAAGSVLTAALLWR